MSPLDFAAARVLRQLALPLSREPQLNLVRLPNVLSWTRGLSRASGGYDTARDCRAGRGRTRDGARRGAARCGGAARALSAARRRTRAGGATFIAANSESATNSPNKETTTLFILPSTHKSGLPRTKPVQFA